MHEKKNAISINVFNTLCINAMKFVRTAYSKYDKIDLL